MISLYGGRLLLFCDQLDHNWHAQIALGPKPEHRLTADTGTVHLSDALQRAVLIYKAAAGKMQVQGRAPMCWDCLQWDVGFKRCALEFPESKKSGGRYASRCSLYTPADDYQPPKKSNEMP
jgi:hypothetical protein